jgi:hypothetical protein
MKHSVVGVVRPRITVFLFLTVLLLSIGFPVAAQALHIPANLVIREDDRAAILSWDFYPANPVSPLSDGVMGYRVVWGPLDQPQANVKLTDDRFMQLQPLVNGQQYTVQVQAVNSYGELSASSAALTFTGNSARVDALRTRMNGFFDDFNLGTGAADERKWNAAYSRCNEPSLNAFFINNQYHAHNMVLSGECDRSFSISRPRAFLDFSDNGTRSIVFDLDGEFGRNIWYLDIVPGLHDVTGHVSPGTGDERAHPGGGVRIEQSGNNLIIRSLRPDGTDMPVATTDSNPYSPLDWAGVPLVVNVRRHWEVRLSRTQMAIYIDGQLVLQSPPNSLQLTENQYSVLWNVFSYNTTKANVPYVLVHWDNFGFDAPATTQNTTVTHNYRVRNDRTDYIHATDFAPATMNINIPDSMTGALARRLMFTLQMHPWQSYRWSAQDRVQVNGVEFPIAQPRSMTTNPLDLEHLVSAYIPYTVVIPLPGNVLRTGQNTLTFLTQWSGIHNAHIELDFPRASAPAYTPPSVAAPGGVMPTMPDVGLAAGMTNVGDVEILTWLDYLSDESRYNPTVSGTVAVRVAVHHEHTIQAIGVNPGILGIDLLVNGQVIQSQRTDNQVPAPASVHTFTLETAQFADGVHELYVRAYNVNCTPSIPDYGGGGVENGRYFPIHFTFANGSSTTTATPVAGLCNGGDDDNDADHNHGSPLMTPTPTQSGATVNGTMQLQGRMPGTALQSSLQVDLLLPGGALMSCHTVNSDAQGNFRLLNVSSGNYIVRVKRAGYLATAQSITVNGGDVSVNMGTLLAGDANDDNQVTLADFSILAGSFNLSSGMMGYDPRADLNGDGAVTLTDFSLLSGNFNTTGM